MIHPDDDVLLDLAVDVPTADGAVRDHVLDCRRCLARVESYRDTVHLLQDDSPVRIFKAPPPDTWEAVRAEIDREVPPNVARSGGRDASDHRGARWWWLGGGIAAGLAAGLLAGTSWFPRQDAPEPVSSPAPTQTVPPVVAQATLTPPRGGAIDGQATLTRDVQGVEHLDLRVSRMSPPAAEEVYEVWLLHRDGLRMISLGVMPDGPEGVFPVPAALVSAGYDVVDVSKEPLDGDLTHSGKSLLRGRLST